MSNAKGFDVNVGETGWATWHTSFFYSGFIHDQFVTMPDKVCSKHSHVQVCWPRRKHPSQPNAIDENRRVLPTSSIHTGATGTAANSRMQGKAIEWEIM